MIKIKREQDTAFLSASVTDFADSLGYCEYKIPLSIRGVRPRRSRSLIMGARAHHAEAAYEREHVKLEPVTAEDIVDEQRDIEFARENVYSTLSVPFELPTENALVTLSGRIDKISRVDGTLIVQDDKFVADPHKYDGMDRPYPGQMLQVLAYLNSVYSPKRGGSAEDLFEMPHAKKRWELRICDRMTREPHRVFSEYQDDSSLSYLHASLRRFAVVALGIAEPMHHNSQSKCDACGLRDACYFRI